MILHSIKASTEQTSGEVPGWKRFLDLSCILLSLPLWLPVMVLASLAIIVVSPGPILFRQERVGYRGRRFRCLKFRTMLVGADASVHKSHLHSLMNSRAPMKKLDVAGDSRLIPLGALLRSTGLDELPQIINVLRGDMSLVGPRPCVPYEFEEYRPWQKERIKGLPG